MKFLIVILALVALVQADDWSPKTIDEIKIIPQICAKDEFEKRRENDYPDKESVRNYVLCTGKAWGIYDAGKGYKAERIAQQFKGDLSENEIKTIVNDCAEKFKEDKKAFHILKCICASRVGAAVKQFLFQSLKHRKFFL